MLKNSYMKKIGVKAKVASNYLSSLNETIRLHQQLVKSKLVSKMYQNSIGDEMHSFLESQPAPPSRMEKFIYS